MFASFIASIVLLHPVAGYPLTEARAQAQDQHDLNIPDSPDHNTDPILNNLQSFSLEFSFFPDFAGNNSHPNEFSKTLLDNLKDITGTPPVIRVGGTTQDRAEYIPTMQKSIQNIFTSPDDDQPAHTNYGPAYFESYAALGDYPFIHGLNFNLSLAQETSAVLEACRTVRNGNFLYELGNEINMEPARYRSKDYSMQDYVHEWNDKTAALRQAYEENCPGSSEFGLMAPSFILPYFHSDDINHWSMEEMYSNGYDPETLTREISAHHYMETNKEDESTLPPVSVRLQNVLLNHTNIKANLAGHTNRANNLIQQGLSAPYTLGETNSIARQGRNGETNVFGAALWLVDFSLWAASHSIRRLHFHQGTGYRYGSWQPVPYGEDFPVATRPPYYGQIMVAKALGQSTDMRISNLALEGDTNAAYALFDGGRLARVVVLNMRIFESGGASGERPSALYRFRVPGAVPDGSKVKVDRLMAAGSDAEEGVTFGGVSYDYGLQQGKPVVVDEGEEGVTVQDGVVAVDVPDSSAVLLSFTDS